MPIYRSEGKDVCEFFAGKYVIVSNKEYFLTVISSIVEMINEVFSILVLKCLNINYLQHTTQQKK